MRTLPTAGNPVVYGEWLGAPGRPTVLVYGHYDVQPPDPLEKWHSPPWTPTVRDGRLYARGVSDDKGPMLIPIEVAEAFFATAGGLPVNVKFMFEGEEEIGSRHLDAFVRAAQGAPRRGCRRVGGRRDVAHRRAVAHRGEPRTLRARAHAHGGLEGSALGPSRRRRGESAARDGHAHRLAARVRRRAWRWPGSTTPSASCRQTSARRSPRCRSTSGRTSRRSARRPPSASPATRRSSANGRGPRSRSTACGAATRDRARRP